MIEHGNPTHGPGAYTLFTSPRSYIAAAAQRATNDLIRHDKRSREESDLARWEGEGGKQRPRGVETYRQCQSRDVRFLPIRRRIVSALH